MEHQRILITGCGGMLGNAIFPYFKRRCSEVLATDIQIEPEERGWLTRLDARDDQAMEAAIKEFRPDLILHLAAETNIEKCEEDPVSARETNTKATALAARLANQYDATLVYISTGGVFDGEKQGYYTEDDVPRPLMVYGASKLEGEQEVRKIGGKSYVIRPGWMVGGGPKNDHKFVSYILTQLGDGAREIFAVNDRFGTPTYTHDFANNLFALLSRGLFGTYHMVCKGKGTRFDVAKEIVKICGLEHDVVVRPVGSSYFDARFWAPRPVNEMLTNRSLERLGINLMRDWRVALADYLARDYAHLIQAADGVETIDAFLRRQARQDQNPALRTLS